MTNEELGRKWSEAGGDWMPGMLTSSGYRVDEFDTSAGFRTGDNDTPTRISL